jgi:hypothetical protein
MVEEVKSDMLEVDTTAAQVFLLEEDSEQMRELQVAIDSLGKLRQEIGRLTQVVHNLVQKTNEAEKESSQLRTSLVKKYQLDSIPGQWVIDFDNKKFVKLMPTMPVVP